jgi:hypothetical protein
MLSYKQWQAINESVMPNVSLGVKSPQSLGVLSQFDLYDEAKKKSKKKMRDEDMDMKDDEDEDEDVTGDGEMVDASSEKDEPDDVEGDEEGESGCKFCGKNSKKKSKKKAEKKSKKKMWSDEDDEDGDEDMGHESDEGEDEDMDDEDGEEETEEDLEGETEEDDEDRVAKMKSSKEKPNMDGNAMSGKTMFSKKKCGKDMGKSMFSNKKSKKKMQKESTEDEVWMNSVKSMLGAPVDVKFDDGWSAYNDPLSPLPGEVGYAPQSRVGN